MLVADVFRCERKRNRSRVTNAYTQSHSYAYMFAWPVDPYTTPFSKHAQEQRSDAIVYTNEIVFV